MERLFLIILYLEQKNNMSLVVIKAILSLLWKLIHLKNSINSFVLTSSFNWTKNLIKLIQLILYNDF